MNIKGFVKYLRVSSCAILSVALPVNAAKFAGSVTGDVSVILPSVESALVLKPGTVLPEGAQGVFGGGSQVMLVCTSDGEKITVSSAQAFAKACAGGRSTETYRAGAETDYPVLLFPNQAALSIIDEIVWGGAVKQYYQVQIIEHKARGAKVTLFDSGKLALRPSNTKPPVFKYRMETPLSLSFSEGSRYQVLVSNLTRNKSTNDGPLPAQLITTPSPSKARQSGVALKGDSGLETLATAVLLYEQDLRYQAYQRLNDALTSYQSQAYRLRGDLWRHPSIPFSYAAHQYGLALHSAHQANDPLNAVLACLELQADPQQLKQQLANLKDFIPPDTLNRYCR